MLAFFVEHMRCRRSARRRKERGNFGENYVFECGTDGSLAGREEVELVGAVRACREGRGKRGRSKGEKEEREGREGKGKERNTDKGKKEMKKKKQPTILFAYFLCCLCDTLPAVCQVLPHSAHLPVQLQDTFLKRKFSEKATTNSDKKISEFGVLKEKKIIKKRRTGNKH